MTYSTPAERAAVLRGSAAFLLLAEVRVILGDWTAADVLAAVQGEELRAVDISLFWPDATRRELRFYRAPVLALAAGQPVPPRLASGALFARGQVVVEEEALTTLFRCGPAHCMALRDRGPLLSFCRPVRRAGQTGLLFDRATICHFIEQREVRFLTREIPALPPFEGAMAIKSASKRMQGLCNASAGGPGGAPNV